MSTLLIGFALALATAVMSGPEGRPVELRRLDPQHVEVIPIAGTAAGKGNRLSLRFLPAEWPHLTVRAPSSWDWSGSSLLLELANPGREAIAFGIRVDDVADSDGETHCRTADGTIEAGASSTFAVSFGKAAADYGMRALPGRSGVRTLRADGRGPFRPDHVVAFQIFLHRPRGPQVLTLTDVRVAPDVPLEGIVDRFGQYARGQWPGKVGAEAELARRREAEADDLRDHPPLPDRDRFGGWARGPRLKPSGFFRAAEVGGRWWLVDPDGSLFFSTGIAEVRPDFPTFLTGREAMFASLPGPGDPLARSFGTTRDVHSGPVRSGRTFDFYGANLARKYGPDPIPAWKEVTLRRLPSWGFNTFGNWSDRFHRNGRVPYVASVGIRGAHARVRTPSDTWAPMHDPFDPRFAASVSGSLAEAAAAVKGDPWCLGYFIDNELSWGGSPDGAGDGGERHALALGTLAGDRRSPAKSALLAGLRSRYGTIAGLNAAWGTKLAGWDALEPPFLPSPPHSRGLAADLARFSREFAGRYFATVRRELRRLDPDHLYLGCRFATFTPEAVAAAAESCDVVSFNVYKDRVDRRAWAFLESMGKPALIGEFHFGATDRGMFHPGLVAAASQADRASRLAAYVESVVDHPSFVGCHWFQYADEPLTGRTFDGENYAVGFVSVTDTPYPELVASARALHRTLYPRRHRGGPPRPPR